MRRSFAGAPAEVALAKRRESDVGIDQSVTQIPQRLPKGGAPAGALFNAGKAFCARLPRADDLAKHLFEKQIGAQLEWRSAVLRLELQGQLVEGEHINIEQGQTVSVTKNHL